MTPDKAEPASYDEYGNLWDDVQTGLKWKPILPLLKRLEMATGTINKMEAGRDVAAFAIKTGLQADPYRHRAFLIFCKFIKLIKEDPQWLAIVEGILK